MACFMEVNLQPLREQVPASKCYSVLSSKGKQVLLITVTKHLYICIPDTALLSDHHLKNNLGKVSLFTLGTGKGVKTKI